MADVIILAEAFTAKGDSTTSYTQNILEVVDVSSYDSIDFQIVGLGGVYTGGGSSSDGFKVSILTSMQNKSESGWSGIGTSELIIVSSAFPKWKYLVVPGAPSTAPMLRYIRFKVTFEANATEGTFTLTGMGRRGVRIQ